MEWLSKLLNFIKQKIYQCKVYKLVEIHYNFVILLNFRNYALYIVYWKKREGKQFTKGIRASNWNARLASVFSKTFGLPLRSMSLAPGLNGRLVVQDLWIEVFRHLKGFRNFNLEKKCDPFMWEVCNVIVEWNLVMTSWVTGWHINFPYSKVIDLLNVLHFP